MADKSSQPPMYKVYIRGQLFTLSQAQIEFDSPNYFTSAFLEGFQEGQSRTIYPEVHPKLFELIVDYLSGYEILPIPDTMIPPTMGRETVLKNLKKDAEYLGLTVLEKRINDKCWLD
ncbi:hypothetical protein BT69DRAFT_849459 [Atractiella rhizophila]|nr:hypothetical protein BT69DRAFT_849459 [Atractiella rhizophila]